MSDPSQTSLIHIMPGEKPLNGGDLKAVCWEGIIVCLARPLIFISSSPVGRVPTKIERCVQRLKKHLYRQICGLWWFLLFILLLYKQRYTCNKVNGPGV